jgi:hypothetical protein
VIAPLIDMPGLVAVAPLRFEFRHLAQVMRHQSAINGPQGTIWQRKEYERARELAKQNLGTLFDQFTSEDLATLTWSDIADDVAELTSLARNPE